MSPNDAVKKERKGVRSPSHSTSGDALNKFSDVLDVFDEDIIDPRGAFCLSSRRIRVMLSRISSLRAF
jgi:hypothetical protein